MKAFVFPGQGAQFSGMGKDLYESSALAKEMFDKANEILGFEITKIMFEGTDEELRQAANAVGAKYSAGFEDLYLQETEDAIRQQCLCCIEITIEHMTGKIGKEVLKERS